jgi:hypothetical protein
METDKAARPLAREVSSQVVDALFDRWGCSSDLLLLLGFSISLPGPRNSAATNRNCGQPHK